MIRKERYWVLNNSEFELVQQLLQTHPAYQKLQQGSAINGLFTAMNKATEEKLAAEQQQVQQEPETEQVYQNQGRGMPVDVQPMHPPRRGVAAKVSSTQPPVPPQPQKKKPNFITRKASPAEEEEETQEPPEEDESDTVDQDELLDQFSDEDF
jgi:hypothetical protein